MAPVTKAISWRPAYHAKLVERSKAPQTLVSAAERTALEAMLRTDPAPARVDAAFTAANRPSRYCDGTHAAFYAATNAITALTEKLHHDAAYLRRRNAPHHAHAVELLKVDVVATVEDVRAVALADPAFMHDSDYSAPQAYARNRLADGAVGLLYPSVRDHNEPCAVLFEAAAVSNPRVHKAVTVEWDGAQFINPTI